MIEHLQVVTTCSSEDEALKLARALVDRRQAACVQVLGPISSFYWWKGRVESSREWMCIAKSTRDIYPQLEAAIRSLHSYTVPEILAMPVAAGNPAYLSWLEAETRGGGSR